MDDVKSRDDCPFGAHFPHGFEKKTVVPGLQFITLKTLMYSKNDVILL